MSSSTRFLLMIIISGIVHSCKLKTTECNIDHFDRGKLLENWADNIIIPSYEDYVVNLVNLKGVNEQFLSDPSQTNLEELRKVWFDAYISWQRVSIYEIGRAEVIRLRDFTNTYPLDVSKVERNIETGKYIISNSTNINAQGFPAIDYLINGLGSTDEEILNRYNQGFNSVGYKNYLTKVIQRLFIMGNEVLDNWQTYYRDVFISKDCSSSTASLDKLTNDMIFNLEKVTRKAKIGDPIDFFGEPPVIAPEKVEALYKQDTSKDLLIASLVASQDLFNGKHMNSATEGASLKSYLDELQIEAGGKLLSTVINERYDAALAQAQTLDANFYTGIQNDRDKYKETRDKIHKVIEVLKTNMISALGIKADYNDSDGD